MFHKSICYCPKQRGDAICRTYIEPLHDTGVVVLMLARKQINDVVVGGFDFRKFLEADGAILVVLHENTRCLLN